MRKFIILFAILVILFLWSGSALAQGELQFIKLGNYRLENGQIISNCRLAYRTFGALNEDKSNIVLFPTWLAGTTKDLVDLGLIGPGKLADSSKYFIVAVDAFGSGVSSSPSNSKLQPNQAFPQFSIKDMVDTQYILLTRYLHLTRIHGVIGISMGAMMAYQWMVSYPDFINKVVAIVGTPKLTSYDLLLWQAELNAINACAGKSKNTCMKVVADIHNLHSRTPQYVTANILPESFPQFLTEAERGIMKFNAYDWAWQLKAIVGHDIYRSFGGKPETAANTIRAKALIVWAKQDLTANSEPAQILARYLHAETLELPGDCGHLSFLCASEILRDRVNTFME
ncbi:homoserine o-acetyltransferase [hydrocarbon metagenome]|uniref:Homoserine o-acetyltransferase n=1 Tax=hydrocarbon metagenome TaxID=938273 RepID=A0A0W8FRG4_9ZZZZ